jgi:hypothetical protein
MSNQLEHAFSFIEPIKAFYVKVERAESGTPTGDEIKALISEYKQLMNVVKHYDRTTVASNCRVGLREWLERLRDPLVDLADRVFPESRIPIISAGSTGEVIAYRSVYRSELLQA